MQNKSFSIGVIDIMNDKWSYCCRCDEDDVMVPQGENQWQCVKCGLRITAQRIERDLFSSDDVLTPEEVDRHVKYLTHLAEKKAKAIFNPPPVPFRMKIVIQFARLLRVPLYRIPNVGGINGKYEKNQTA